MDQPLLSIIHVLVPYLKKIPNQWFNNNDQDSNTYTYHKITRFINILIAHLSLFFSKTAYFNKLVLQTVIYILTLFLLNI